jgi:cytochrome c oxidase cbb3-type subunit I/II
MAFGMIYWLVPRMTKGPYSLPISKLPFLDRNLGIILYTLPMYVAGFLQASMWKQFNPDGTLTYGNFLETVTNHAYVLDACHRRYFIPYRNACISL